MLLGLRDEGGTEGGEAEVCLVKLVRKHVTSRAEECSASLDDVSAAFSFAMLGSGEEAAIRLVQAQFNRHEKGKKQDYVLATHKLEPKRKNETNPGTFAFGLNTRWHLPLWMNFGLQF